MEKNNSISIESEDEIKKVDLRKILGVKKGKNNFDISSSRNESNYSTIFTYEQQNQKLNAYVYDRLYKNEKSRQNLRPYFFTDEENESESENEEEGVLMEITNVIAAEDEPAKEHTEDKLVNDDEKDMGDLESKLQNIDVADVDTSSTVESKNVRYSRMDVRTPRKLNKGKLLTLHHVLGDIFRRIVCYNIFEMPKDFYNRVLNPYLRIISDHYEALIGEKLVLDKLADEEGGNYKRILQEVERKLCEEALFIQLIRHGDLMSYYVPESITEDFILEELEAIVEERLYEFLDVLEFLPTASERAQKLLSEYHERKQEARRQVLEEMFPLVLKENQKAPGDCDNRAKKRKVAEGSNSENTETRLLTVPMHALTKANRLDKGSLTVLLKHVNVKEPVLLEDGSETSLLFYAIKNCGPSPAMCEATFFTRYSKKFESFGERNRTMMIFQRTYEERHCNVVKNILDRLDPDDIVLSATEGNPLELCKKLRYNYLEGVFIEKLYFQ